MDRKMMICPGAEGCRSTADCSHRSPHTYQQGSCAVSCHRADMSNGPCQPVPVAAPTAATPPRYYIAYSCRPVDAYWYNWELRRYCTDAEGNILDGPQPGDRLERGSAVSHAAAGLAAAAVMTKWAAEEAQHDH